MCLLHPITWEEPFGLALIESMACGTPVVAFKHGSSSEIIINKKTGYIVKTTAEMIKAVKKIGEILRKDCRFHVEANFNLKKMVDAYEDLYYKVVDGKITRRRRAKASVI